MARIKISDLPKAMAVSKKEMKAARGGMFSMWFPVDLVQARPGDLRALGEEASFIPDGAHQEDKCANDCRISQTPQTAAHYGQPFAVG